jgi:hypothetical protein
MIMSQLQGTLEIENDEEESAKLYQYLNENLARIRGKHNRPGSTAKHAKMISCNVPIETRRVSKNAGRF